MRVKVLSVCAVWLALTGPALAVDGVIQINQAKALAGGVTPGDAPGFPIHIFEPGSYRLTSDLQSASGIAGIIFTVDDTTLDLNGFRLLGGGEVGAAHGISLGGGENIEIRNGTVVGFLGHGIFGGAFSSEIRVIGVRSNSNNFSGFELQGPGNLVEHCTALDNGGAGIRAGEGSLVINSVARGNGDEGLELELNAGYRSNTLTNNNGGGINPQVANGIQLGTNLCGGDILCP